MQPSMKRKAYAQAARLTNKLKKDFSRQS